MSYELKKITDSDKKKILEDLDCNAAFKRRVQSGRCLDRPLSWAIDKDTGNYFFHVDSLVFDSSDARFLCFISSEWYEIYFRSLVGNSVNFSPSPPSKEKILEIKDEIASGLSILGRYGSGVSGSFDSIKPDFMGVL